MRQGNRFGEPDLGLAKRLAHAVGFAYRVGIDERNIQASGMTEGKKRLVQIRQATDDSAAVSAAADDQDVDCPFEQLRIRGMGHRGSSALSRQTFSISIEGLVEGSRAARDPAGDGFARLIASVEDQMGIPRYL